MNICFAKKTDKYDLKDQNLLIKVIEQIAEIRIPSTSSLTSAEEVLVPGQGWRPVQILIVVPGANAVLSFGPEIANIAQSCLRSISPVVFCEVFLIKIMVGQKMNFFFGCEVNLWVPFQQRIQPRGPGLHGTNAEK